MKQIYLWIGLCAVIVAAVLVGLRYVSYTPKQDISPRGVITSLLPSSWEVTVIENENPLEWSGSKECTAVSARNPSEVYMNEPSAPVGFRYTAFHDFWFCPKHWVGKVNTIRPYEQRYAAGELCDCKNYKIFHLSLGSRNSQKDLPKRVKEAFNQ